MKFLSFREQRGNSARVWRELPKEREMVVTSNGRPVALLTAVDQGTVEQSLSAWRRVRAIQAISDIQQESMRKGIDQLAMTDIVAEITRVRQGRRKPAT
jgi:antitoxin (DNA-binding transcriptional repressor) of toxin-antitoxin stability system